MDYFPDPQLRNELLKRLAVKYGQVRPEKPHLSELIGCLTKSWFDQRARLEPTDMELTFYTIGFGLESVMLRQDGDTPPETRELDGVWLTPDYLALRGGQMDLKSTRMYAGEDGSPKNGWPDSWLKQFMAYSYQDWTSSGEVEVPQYFYYSVGVVYIGMPPSIQVGTFRWEPIEVLGNWREVLDRRDTYNQYIEGVDPPTPFHYNADWECGNCRYLPRCQNITGEEGPAKQQRTIRQARSIG